MPRGQGEQFFVELKPDYDQKKVWERIEKQSMEISDVFKGEVRRQHAILGTPIAKNLYLEAPSVFDFAHELLPLAVLRIKEAVHDTFREEVKRKRGRGMFPVEVDPRDVHFSTMGTIVRIPYLGLVKHRPNQKILSTSDESKWVMENVTSMRLTVKNHYLCLVIDCREDPSPKKKAKSKPPSRKKSSKWLE